MFGFGKKRLSDRMIGMVSVELAMFMRWMEEHRHRMLSPPEVQNIAAKILHREGYKYTKGQLFAVTLAAMSSGTKEIDEVRKNTDFDKTIDGFCKSIGIKADDYMNRQQRRQGERQDRCMP